MPKFVTFFTLNAQTISRFIDNPSDRAAAVRALIEPAGGKLEAYYFMFGAEDGMVIYEVAEASSAAAISLAVSSTGAFGHLRTHELIPAENINAVLERAKAARASYRPPGA
jgi:uncharacterized protein with GYD domain